MDARHKRQSRHLFRPLHVLAGHAFRTSRDNRSLGDDQPGLSREPEKSRPARRRFPFARARRSSRRLDRTGEAASSEDRLDLRNGTVDPEQGIRQRGGAHGQGRHANGRRFPCHAHARLSFQFHSGRKLRALRRRARRPDHPHAGRIHRVSRGRYLPFQRHETHRRAVPARSRDAADWRSLHDGAARGGARDSLPRREACDSDALRHVPRAGRDAGRAAQGSPGYCRTDRTRPETRGTSVNLTDNLRSGYIQEDVEQYVYDLLPASDGVLAEMEEYAAGHNVPIIGPAVARFLALLVQISGAQRIFEMGSAIGYSTIWLARAAGPKAQVFYTDGDPENARLAEAHFRKAGVAKRIRIQTGNALELLKKTPGKFGLIFNDVDKHQYPEAMRIAVPKLKRGGLFVTDNTLWSGRAARPAAPGDKNTLGVQELNRLTFSSKELFPVLLPLRDGVTVARKL